MGDLSLEWAGDLQVGPDGDLLTVSGFDETRQALTRILLSNPRQPDPNQPGKFLAADVWYDPTYGLGLRRIIGKHLNAAAIPHLIGKVKAAMRKVPGIAISPPPTIVLQPVPGGAILGGSFAESGTGRIRSIPQIDLSQ